eukprot:jgi/Bigna1/142098/aug1.67_g16806
MKESKVQNKSDEEEKSGAEGGKETFLMEFFKVPEDLLGMPLEERKKVCRKLMKSTKSPDGFPKGSLTESADISFLEEVMVVAFFSVMMGGPIISFFIGLYLIAYGSYLSWAKFMIVMAILAFHPIPKFYQGLIQSKFSLAIYKYFSFRMIIEDIEMSDQKNSAWVGASGPHGVLPIANIVSMLGINLFARPFVGGAASVVLNTPFLRYMSLFGGMVDVSGKTLQKTTGENLIGLIILGIVPDGIAGMFKTGKDDEVVFLQRRMGLAKFALRTGVTVVPAYSIGNTKIFTPWFDSLGIMEFLSRRAKASFLVFWGRWYLPIPRRYNITLLCGKAIKVEKMRNEDIEDHVGYFVASARLNIPTRFPFLNF